MRLFYISNIFSEKKILFISYGLRVTGYGNL